MLVAGLPALRVQAAIPLPLSLRCMRPKAAYRASPVGSMLSTSRSVSVWLRQRVSAVGLTVITVVKPAGGQAVVGEEAGMV